MCDLIRFRSIGPFSAILRLFYFAEMLIWVPSGASTKHFLVSKSSSGQYATFDTQQCFVLAPEGTQITDFLLPIRDFFSILRFFHFAEMAISVPSGTITEHCLVPKSSSGQGATFGTKQCSVIVPEGTQITDFLLPVRDFLEFCDFLYFAEMAIWVPFATSTRHCLVSKVSSAQDATFDTKQCLVLAAIGTQITDFLIPIKEFSAILRFIHFAEMAIWVPSGTITEHCLVPKSSSGQGASFGTKQCSVIVPEGTQITDFLLPVRDFLEFCDFFLFCGNGNLSTFRSEYKALLGAKIFVWSRRNFWHQAVPGNRCGRYSNCRFSTSNPKVLLTKMWKLGHFWI